MTHEQIEQIFNEESDDDEFFGFESILLVLVRLILGFDLGGLLLQKLGMRFIHKCGL